MKKIFTAFMMMLCVACVASAANYLTFTAAEDGSTFGIKNTYNDPDVQYSLDDGATWTVLADGDSIALAKKGDKALLKGNNPEGFSHDYLNCTQFVMSGSISASGSVMSLIDGVGESLTIPNKRCFYYLFRDCGSLIQAPELPATTLKDSCYAYMFYFCTNLEKAAELPATELTPGCYLAMFACCRRLTEVPLMPATVMARRCYDSMFLGCYSLRKTPDLIATTLAKGCYTNMFCYCKGLKEVGELPATELADSCYYSMFQTCDSLVVLPELPATQLAPSCYNSMFEYCVSLTEAPELPATKMEELCYYNMFSNCYSLKKAPELISTEPAARCYNFMFTSCQNLSELKVYFTDLNLEYVDYGSMLSGVSGPGKFICPLQFPADSIKMFLPYLWEVEYFDIVDTTVNYLTFTAEEDGSTFGIINEGGNNPDVQYSLDGGETWTALAAGVTITLAHKGDKALLRGDNPEGFSKGKYEFSTFKLTGKVAASGSVMSLIDGVGISTEIPGEFCFRAMFLGCTSLTQAPELPATILADNCYWGMFYHCTSLTQAPELPATTLAEGCYYEMFSGCTSLSEIKVPFDDWNRGHYTAEWVIDVAPTGTFICPKALALEYGWESIPEGWTVKYIDDTVAVEANYLTFTAEEDGSSFGIVSNEGNNPDVQYSLDGGKTWTTLAVKDAITLAHKGDKALLRGDNPDGFSRFLSPWTMYTSFTMTGKIAASGSVMSLIDGIGETLVIPNDICFYKLFFGCASLTQAPELPATTLAGSCYEGMFSGCTSLTQAPKLPATTLAKECYWEMFRGCTSLAQAPKLPATTLAGYCYCGMFDGCTGLTEAPELPVTTLAEWCYYGMFSGCTRLTQAPVLPANTLAGYCYNRMFQGCTSLTQAPELPATTLSGCCYSAMFRGCTNLTQAPELPATTLAGGCYSSMFSGCTSLAQAPELPATTMAFHCYEYMFYGCTSLTKAPELPATELPDSLFMRGGCCESMFSGCTNLSEISIAFDKWNDNTFEWVKDVAPTGTFICPKDLPLEYGVSRIPEGWTVKYIDDTVAVETNYLTFTAEEDGSTFGIVNGRNSPNVLYSLDGGKTWTFLAEGDTVRLAHKGDKALLKGNNPQGFSRNYMEYQSSFKMTGKIAASGSVMSLIDGTGLSSEIRGVECFGRLFENCTSLTQAPELPATTLTEDCYYGMFRGCTGLTQAPELPATTLADWCYRAMFEGCTGLIQAPELPATTLVSGCYSEMFRGCTGLTQAPELPATSLAGDCYDGMFRGCTSLSKAPALPATTLAEYCYSDMFSSCTSLTEAPELPATTLANNCYAWMFSGCTSLTKAPNLPATELPAPVNKNSCYGSMFSNCTNLSEISVAFNVWDDNTSWWVKNVAPTGTFICPKTLPLEYGDSKIPEGWTVKYPEEVSVADPALADGITVWTDDLTIYVRGAKGEVSIYDMSGRIVATSNSKDEERALCVPSKGVYVVRTNNGTSDVLVR